VDGRLVLLKDVCIEDKQATAAKSAVFPQQLQDRGCYAGTTTLWDKRAEFHDKDETLKLRLTWDPSCLRKLKPLKK
jgi:hypothetical protein